jgi:hypothetical protein
VLTAYLRLSEKLKHDNSGDPYRGSNAYIGQVASSIGMEDGLSGFYIFRYFRFYILSAHVHGLIANRLI